MAEGCLRAQPGSLAQLYLAVSAKLLWAVSGRCEESPRVFDPEEGVPDGCRLCLTYRAVVLARSPVRGLARGNTCRHVGPTFRVLGVCCLVIVASLHGALSAWVSVLRK